MATVARFAVVRDARFTLDWNTSFDESFSFDAPDRIPGAAAVLMLRVDPKNTASDSGTRLSVLLNGVEILNQVFDTDPQRTWHETFTEALKQTNVLTFRNLTSAGPFGSMDLADVVVMYQASSGIGFPRFRKPRAS